MSDVDEGGVLFVIGLIAVGAYVQWVGYNESWYAWKYNISSSNVSVERMPKDCEFMSAPLGSKNCHYEPHVSVFNADDIFIGGTENIKFSTDNKTKRPIVSYDDGKTWQWYRQDTLPSTKAHRARVTWIKISE